MIFFSSLYNKRLHSYGFTFIEVVIAVAIASTLFGIISLNLLNIHQAKTVDSASEILVSDLRSQQTKAMSLSIQNDLQPDSYGIFFDTNSYFLFKGPVFDPENLSNSEVELPAGFSFTDISFPDSQIVFAKGSGEILNFINGQNSITVHDANEQNSRSFQLNQYGVINYN